MEIKDKTAIVIVDPYNEFMSWKGKLWPQLRKVSLQNKVRENIIKIVDAGRKNKVLIAYAPHKRTVSGQFRDRKYLLPTHVGIKSFNVFGEGTFGGRFYNPLIPHPNDIISSEHMCSSGFAETDLHDQLKSKGIEHIILIGYTSNTCIEATARTAVDLDYKITLVTDAVASWTPEDHHAAISVNYKWLTNNLTSTEKIITDIKKLNQEYV